MKDKVNLLTRPMASENVPTVILTLQRRSSLSV